MLPITARVSSMMISLPWGSSEPGAAASRSPTPSRPPPAARAAAPPRPDPTACGPGCGCCAAPGDERVHVGPRLLRPDDESTAEAAAERRGGGRPCRRRTGATGSRTTASSWVTSTASQVRVKHFRVGLRVVTTAGPSSATRYFAWYFTTGSANQLTMAPICLERLAQSCWSRRRPPFARLVSSACTATPRSSAPASASSTSKSSQRKSDSTVAAARLR